MTGFDHARPLWEMVVLEGLEDGRTALVQKIHHSLADGVGMMKLSMAFLDLEAEPSGRPDRCRRFPSQSDPSAVDQIRAGIAYHARRQMATLGAIPRRVGAIARNPVGAAQEARDSAASAARVLRPVSEPMSPLMTARSRGIRFDTLTASLPAMKAASKRVDGRLNDAFMAAVAGGLDRYHRSARCHGGAAADVDADQHPTEERCSWREATNSSRMRFAVPGVDHRPCRAYGEDA